VAQVKHAALLVLALTLGGCSAGSQELIPAVLPESGISASENPVAESNPPAETDHLEQTPPDSSATPDAESIGAPLPALEALESAASRVITDYLAATDAIGANAGRGDSRMAELVTPQWLPTEQRAFADYRSQAIRTIGRTVFDSLTIQSARWDASGRLEVAAFVCVDSRGVWVIPQQAEDPPEDLWQWMQEGADPALPSEEQSATWQDYLDATQPRPGFREPIVVWLLGSGPNSLLIDATDNWRGYHPCDVPE